MRNQIDLRRLGLAILAAAVLDAGFAFVAYVIVDGRYTFESLLQYIASGLLGHGAFTHSGVTGWLIAGLGFALHLLITTLVALTYVLVIRPRVRTTNATVLAGLLYGAAVWVFNDAVILPLSAAAHEPFFGGDYVSFLIDHAILVGLSIALITGPATASARAAAHHG
jgi:uncharacterized membrane protein YagU involved in acid resistance